MFLKCSHCFVKSSTCVWQSIKQVLAFRSQAMQQDRSSARLRPCISIGLDNYHVILKDFLPRFKWKRWLPTARKKRGRARHWSAHPRRQFVVSLLFLTDHTLSSVSLLTSLYSSSSHYLTRFTTRAPSGAVSHYMYYSKQLLWIEHQIVYTSQHNNIQRICIVYLYTYNRLFYAKHQTLHHAIRSTRRKWRLLSDSHRAPVCCSA